MWDSIEEILENVKLVNVQINEIPNAYREQSLGIEEVAKAMNIMDNVSLETKAVATDTTSSADKPK